MSTTTTTHPEPGAKQASEVLNIRRVWWPIALGIGVAAYLFVRDEAFSVDSLRLIGQANGIYLLLALGCLAIHDISYMYRIRVITQNQLGWRSSIYIILLWAFSSSVTPSVAGGGVIAIFLLSREGVQPGKALAYVILTVILDNLLLVLLAPVAYWSAGDNLFSASGGVQLQGSFAYVFWVGYTLITAYTLIISFALFVQPKGFKWILLKITSIPFLKRWQEAASAQGNELIAASEVLRGNSTSYWVKAILSSAVAWLARFTVLNFLVSAYVPLDWAGQVVVFSKHLMLWIVMVVSPTPGSSGAAEFFFQQFYQGTLGEYTLATDFIWRIMTYYLYLALGAICLPRWLKYVADRDKSEGIVEGAKD